MTTYTIQPLRLGQMTHREFESLMQDSQQILRKFAQSYRSESMYASYLPQFDQQLEQFQLCLNRVHHKQMTTTEADQERDAAVRALLMTHRGFRSIKVPAIQNAYEILLPLMTKYKNIPRHKNDVVTSEINSLLCTVEKSPYREALAKLGLTPLVRVLAQAQAQYKEVFAQAQTFRISQKELKAQDVRKELKRLYDLFVRYTAITAEVFPDQLHYTQLLEDLNQLRKEKQGLEKRKQRKALKNQNEPSLQS